MMVKFMQRKSGCSGLLGDVFVGNCTLENDGCIFITVCYNTCRCGCVFFLRRKKRKEASCVEFLGQLLEFLDAEMETPTMYGWFHLLFFAISVAAGVALCRLKRPDDVFVSKLLRITAVVSIVLEIYKQVNYTFCYDGQSITADYQWYAFPFQFCSTPMYVGLLAGLLRKGKLREALCAYLATYALFGGLVVMVYPGQVFIDTIGINIQTMICHGSMVTVGIYLLYTQYVKLEHKTILKAIPVFACLVAMATVMNEIAYASGLLEHETFNMFFISPHCEPSLPVYSLVQAVVPYPWCLILYVLIFTLAAYIMLLIAILVKNLAARRKPIPVS